MPSSADENLSDLERLLRAVRPSSPALDRDRLMYEAGRESARSRRWLWPAAAGAMAALSLVLAVALAVRPAPEPVVQFVHVPAPAPETPSTRVDDLPPVLLPFQADLPPEASWPEHSYGRMQEAMQDGELPPPAPPVFAPPPRPSHALSAWEWHTRSDLVSSLIEQE